MKRLITVLLSGGALAVSAGLVQTFCFPQPVSAHLPDRFGIAPITESEPSGPFRPDPDVNTPPPTPAPVTDLWHGPWCGTRVPSLQESFRREVAPATGMRSAASSEKRFSLAVPGGSSSLGPVTINVHFHVITTESGDGEVSDEALDRLIRVINQGYAGQHDSNGRGVATRFQFIKASVERVPNNEWFDLFPLAEFAPQLLPIFNNIDPKPLLHVGKATDLNIYTTDLYSWGLGGYATFPWDYKDNRLHDGVAIDYRTVPTEESPADPYENGRVSVHEIGHWLGLYHTFYPYELTGSGCTRRNDFVEDTPAEAYPQFNAPTDLPPTPGKRYPDTCRYLPGHDPVESYMDYSETDVWQRFTRGQSARMQLSWYRWRDNSYIEPAPIGPTPEPQQRGRDGR